MVKKTFIPNWYLDKKSQIENKKVKMCIMVVLIVNILLLSCILNISNKLRNLEKVNSNENNKISIVETVKHDIITIEKYKEFINFFDKNNLHYKNVVITKDNLEIEIEVKNYDEYIHVIRCIENHYSIKTLTPNIKNEGIFSIKVMLEV